MFYMWRHYIFFCIFVSFFCLYKTLVCLQSMLHRFVFRQYFFLFILLLLLVCGLFLMCRRWWWKLNKIAQIEINSATGYKIMGFLLRSAHVRYWNFVNVPTEKQERLSMLYKILWHCSYGYFERSSIVCGCFV